MTQQVGLTNFWHKDANVWHRRIRKHKRQGQWYWLPSSPIEFVAAGTIVDNGTGDDLTVPFPAGITDGDFLLIFWHSRQSGRRQTPPEGWQSMLSDNEVNSTYEFFYKWYEDGETEPTIASTTDATADNPIAQMAAFTNVDTILPLDAAGTSFSYASGATTIGPVDAPTLSYTGDLVISAQQWRFDRTCTTTQSESDGQTWNHIGNKTSTEASQGGMSWDYAITSQDSIATITDKNFTLSGNGGGGHGIIFALAQAPRPAEQDEIIAEDLCTNPDPIPIWHEMTTADPDNEDANNWQVQQETDDPSPFIPVGQVAPSGYYRSLQVDSYVLTSEFSLGDTTMDVDSIRSGCPTTGILVVGIMTVSNSAPLGVRLAYTGYTGNQFTGISAPGGETGVTYPIGDRVAHEDEFDGALEGRQDSYRAQLLSGSTLANRSIHIYTAGEYSTTFLSFRLDPNLTQDNLDDLDTPGTGAQLMQLKQTNSTGSPIMSIQEYGSFLRFRYNPTGSSGQNLVDFDRPLTNEWMRIALRILYHPTNGSIDFYAKYAEGDPWETLYQGTNMKTIYSVDQEGGTPYINPSFGPYYKVFMPSMKRNYADFQIVRNWTGAP